MKNVRLIVFFFVLCFFVGGFLWHIQGLQCDDSMGFDVTCHKMFMSFGVLFCIGVLLLVAGGLSVLGEVIHQRSYWAATLDRRRFAINGKQAYRSGNPSSAASR